MADNTVDVFNNSNDVDVFNALESQDLFFFKSIPFGTIKETTVTDLILTAIVSDSSISNIIEYDDSYKETGNRTTDNPKKGTSADFLLVVRDKVGVEHSIAFQAKLGKLVQKNGNEYSEITHPIGSKKNADYQIDRYNAFLKDNSDIIGNYIFYNGNYADVNNKSDILSLDNSSFWILDVTTVTNLVGSTYKTIGLSDVVNKPNYEKFVEFLRSFNI